MRPKRKITNDKNEENERNCVLESKKAKVMRKYRAKVKCDSEKYENMKLKDRERKRKEREMQRLAKQNDQVLCNELKRQKREQQRRFRNKQKLEKAKKAQNENRAKENDLMNKLNEMKAKSEKKKATLRTKMWRMKIQLQNESTSIEEARCRKKTTTSTAKETVVNSETGSTESGNEEVDVNCVTERNESLGFEVPLEESLPRSPYICRQTEYRAVKKVKDTLPKTPEKRAQIIEKLTQSPSVTDMLEKKGVVVTGNTKRQIDIGENIIKTLGACINETKVQGTQTKTKHHTGTVIRQAALKAVSKKYGLKGKFRRSLNLGKNTKEQKTGKWWQPKDRKRRKDRISQNIKEKVKSFFLEPSISREVPCKKEVLNVKEGEQIRVREKHIMIKTMKEAFQDFKQINPAVKIGLTSFSKLKPEYVRQVSETKKRSCLCTICCNIALKAEAMKNLVNGSDELKNLGKDLVFSKKEVSALTVCQNESRPEMKCLNRQCENCGVTKISEYYRDINEYCSLNQKEIKWHKWEYITVKNDDREKRIISCVPRTTSMEAFLSDYEHDMINYTGHVFRASWQHEQMSSCITKLKNGQVMVVMDFAENYKCTFQNEVQSAYFDQNMVTIHPMMYYYRKDLDENNQNVLVKHAIIGITDDLKHDGHVVSMFEREGNKIIQENVDVAEIFQWTDGCAAQYKSKNCFYDISNKNTKLTRNFFETSHGKNVCDGLGAIVKCSCYRAMLAGKVMGDAKAVFSHCTETLQKTNEIVSQAAIGEKTMSLREFVFISSNEITHETAEKVTVVKGTRKIHSVKNSGENGMIYVRNLSCYCTNCVENEPCINQEYVEEWLPVRIQVAGAGKNGNTNQLPKRQTKKGKTSASTKHDSASSNKAPASSNKASAENINQASAYTNQASASTKQASVDDVTDCMSESGTNIHDIHEGDYVLVKLSSARTRKASKFVAQILQMDNEEIQLHYMKEKKKNGESYYIWTDANDISWEDKNCVLKRLSATMVEDISNNRLVYYKFK